MSLRFDDYPTPMLTIAVTGGIACGKNLAGCSLARRGVEVADADTVVHRLMAEDAALRAGLVGAFGDGILGSDGAIDRSILGGLVFSDPGARAVLEAWVHPRVRAALLGWRCRVAQRQPAACAALIPLLFEAGMAADWDVTVCMAAAPVVQEQRLLQRGLPLVEARRRMAAQMAQAEKIAHSDYVVLNNGSRDVVDKQIGWILGRILEAQHGRGTKQHE